MGLNQHNISLRSKRSAIAPAIGARITKAVTFNVKATERTTALSFPASSKASKANPNHVRVSPNKLIV